MVEDISIEALRERDPKKLIPPLHGALLKNEQDVTCSSAWRSCTTGRPLRRAIRP